MRGSGRTTRQLTILKEGGMYVCLNRINIRYAERILYEVLGRSDVIVTDYMSIMRDQHSGLKIEDIAVDHHVWEAIPFLDRDRFFEKIKRIVMSIRQEKYNSIEETSV